jgi:hypothetical protein
MSASSHIVLIDDNPRDRVYYADRLQAMFPECVVVQATTGRNGSLIANAHQETPFDGQVHGCWGDRRHRMRAAVAQFPIKISRQKQLLPWRRTIGMLQVEIRT